MISTSLRLSLIHIWTYVKNCAVLLRRQRQNMINIELEHTLDYRLSADENGRLRFDFTRFDRFVDIMLDERYMGCLLYTSLAR